MKKLLNYALIIITSFACSTVYAANVETELPSNTFISQNGLDWAWAFPLPESGSGFDLSFQSQFGWRLPTAEELQNAPLAVDFKFPDANVPLGGTDPVSGATFQATNADLDGPAACATPYFSTSLNHCDWADGLGQPFEPWAGMDGASSSADQLVVRESLVAGTARFKVTKTFSDGSTDEVDVMLSCNSGLPLEQSFTIAGGDPDGVTFVVTDIPEGGADCEVTESGGPDGYTTELNGGDGCSWDDVTLGFFECEITNLADPASYTVTKDWEIFNDGGDLSFDDEVSVTITCTNYILPLINESKTKTVILGDGGSATVDVDTTEGSATCSAEEVFTQSGVEDDSEGCGETRLDAGGSHICAFTNTVFFEGIPTLSQYGMAIMILLMLGVGFIGFRRIV